MRNAPRLARRFGGRSAREWTAILACTAALGALAGPAVHLALPVDLHAQARTMSTYVSVLDKAGAPVPGLNADEFVVREDGARREVLRVVQPATDQMQIALLIDDTYASALHVQDMRAGIRAFIEALHARHPIAMVTFADRPTVIVDFTQSLPVLEGGIGRLFSRRSSGSYLLDALVGISESFASSKPLRPVIVVISAEGLEFSDVQSQRVLEAIARSGAPVNELLINPQNANPLYEEVRNRVSVLDRAPKLSGGVRYDLLTAMGFADKMKLVATQLLNQYLVIYGRPETLIPPDSCQVTVTRPGLEAHAAPPRRRDQ